MASLVKLVESSRVGIFDEAGLPLYVWKADGTQPYDRNFRGVPEREKRCTK